MSTGARKKTIGELFQRQQQSKVALYENLLQKANPNHQIEDINKLKKKAEQFKSEV